MKSLFGLLVFFSLNVHADNTLPVFDQDFACTDATTANRYVSDMSIDLPSFGGLELCNPAVDSKKLFNDLSLIEQGQFTGAKTNIFIKDFVNRTNYYTWMQGNTRGMNRGNDNPTATAYNRGGYFTMQDGWAKLSTLGRVGVVLHEARHTEGYVHTQCGHGPYQDTAVPGCDERVDDGGSHAVEMEYYARVVVHGSNFHPVYQSMARLMLLARANFVFNDDPMSERDGLVAITEQGLVQIKDSKTSQLMLEKDIPSTAALKRTSFGSAMLDLPHAEAYAIDLTDSQPMARLPDRYSYFKLLQQIPVANLHDVEEFDIGTKRHFFTLDNQGAISGYIYGEGTWTQPANIPGASGFFTLDPSGNEGIFASLGNGTYCSLSEDASGCTGAIKNWPADVKKIAKYKNEVLSLGTDGTVRKADGSALGELQNMKVLDLINVPEYNAFD